LVLIDEPQITLRDELHVVVAGNQAVEGIATVRSHDGGRHRGTSADLIQIHGDSDQPRLAVILDAVAVHVLPHPTVDRRFLVVIVKDHARAGVVLRRRIVGIANDNRKGLVELLGVVTLDVNEDRLRPRLGERQLLADGDVVAATRRGAARQRCHLHDKRFLGRDRPGGIDREIEPRHLTVVALPLDNDIVDGSPRLGIVDDEFPVDDLDVPDVIAVLVGELQRFLQRPDEDVEFTGDACRHVELEREQSVSSGNGDDLSLEIIGDGVVLSSRDPGVENVRIPRHGGIGGLEERVVCLHSAGEGDAGVRRIDGDRRDVSADFLKSGHVGDSHVEFDTGRVERLGIDHHVIVAVGRIAVIDLHRGEVRHQSRVDRLLPGGRKQERVLGPTGEGMHVAVDRLAALAGPRKTVTVLGNDFNVVVIAAVDGVEFILAGPQRAAGGRCRDRIILPVLIKIDRDIVHSHFAGVLDAVAVHIPPHVTGHDREELPLFERFEARHSRESSPAAPASRQTILVAGAPTFQSRSSELE